MLLQGLFWRSNSSDCHQLGRRRHLPQARQSAPCQSWSPRGAESPDLGEALSNESLTPGAVSRLLGNVSFLYVNKSFPEIALITAGLLLKRLKWVLCHCKLGSALLSSSIVFLPWCHRNLLTPCVFATSAFVHPGCIPLGPGSSSPSHPFCGRTLWVMGKWVGWKFSFCSCHVCLPSRTLLLLFRS